MAKKSMKKDVLKRIDSDDVQMHSSVYFAILTAATVFSAALLTISTAITTKYLFDEINYGRNADLLRLGSEGMSLFLSGFPWLLLIITGLSIWGTIWLYKKFDFSYKQNIKVFYGGLAGAVVLLAFLFGSTGVHHSLDDNPFIDRLQTLREKVEDKSIHGTIIEIEEENILIIEPNGDLTKIDIDEAKVYGELEKGKKVRAIGDTDLDEDEDFEAEVIRYEIKKRHKNPRILKETIRP